MKHLLYVMLLGLLFSCKVTSETTTMGTVERIDPSLDNIINQDAKIEVLGEGYEWSEGPLWVAEKNMLLFSDVPKNTV
ncbi:MAG TPA: SMP-30/gluconolactonase/LRE family protein, partial [Chryseosolibacter sp.]|nr:SMP-30/gluconolactonase/LRE family protein [Chryseosolibacter sp.]